jgi:hypothetical protein
MVDKKIPPKQVHCIRNLAPPPYLQLPAKIVHHPIPTKQINNPRRSKRKIDKSPIIPLGNSQHKPAPAKIPNKSARILLEPLIFR